MGGCISRRSSYISNNNIRVVHMNGYVEDFMHPVIVSQVTGNKMPSKYFLCTASQLLSNTTAPLKPDCSLEPGHIYFMLPFSTLETDISPVNLAALARRLTAKAKSKSKSSDHEAAAKSPMRSSPGNSPNRSLAGEHHHRSWKPILDTIREKSFTRSESDLREMHL